MNPIEPLRWKNRVLIVSSVNDKSVALKEQITHLKRNKTGMKERGLVIFYLVGNSGTDPNNKALNEKEVESIRQDYSIPGSEFSVYLIGKDGGVKIKYLDPVSPPEIFKVIDKMPMRKREMVSGS